VSGDVAEAVYRSFENICSQIVSSIGARYTYHSSGRHPATVQQNTLKQFVSRILSKYRPTYYTVKYKKLKIMTEHYIVNDEMLGKRCNVTCYISGVHL